MGPHDTSGTSSASLHVLSGLHEGASHPLDAATLRVGGGGGADLVLADDGLAPVHLEVAVSGGFAHLTAVREGVELEGGRVLAVGQGRDVPLPVHLTVAGVRLCCDGPPPPRRSLPPRAAAVAGAVGLALCTLPMPTAMWESVRAQVRSHPSSRSTGALAAGASLALRPGAPPAQPSASGSAAHPLQRAAAAMLVSRAPMPAGQAAAILRELAARAGLAGLRVDAVEGIVRAQGDIAPAAAAAWQEVRESFDRRTDGRVVLTDEVRAHASQPFSLALDSVWTGNFANIVVGGAKYLEGSVLPNGWTLDRVESGRLLLHRDGAHIEVAF